jgi:TnpA family transposase
MKFATHGYTEIISALWYLLGYYFMPRIRDLKDQQLYRIDRPSKAGSSRHDDQTADLDIVEERDAMLRVALSLATDCSRPCSRPAPH